VTDEAPIVVHPSVEEQREVGKAARKAVPRSSHGEWSPAKDRRDPVALLTEQDEKREQDLVPVRHARMAVSPFTFYRGAARIMAADLASTPVSGITTQICGDAHLSNFGVFASPERRLLFDVNDFDETLPGPWEWDVKRMAASFTIAGRNNGFAPADIAAITERSVAEYRDAMASFAAMGVLETWYASLDVDALASLVKSLNAGKKATKRVDRQLEKARSRTSHQVLSKLGERSDDGHWRIRSVPPVVVPLAELIESAHLDPEAVREGVTRMLRDYRASLPDDRRLLVERFEIRDIARKVVGVGSVGTRAFIVLCRGRDDDDPLFLQVKQASTSVLEEFLPPSVYDNHGERVVQGQRLMQAASDIFLGWTTGALDLNFNYYWRQLKDMKGSAEIETMTPQGLTAYARMCGWTLARAHAKSGSPTAISAYLGTGGSFDKAIVAFSEAYADRNQADYEAFTSAIAEGRLEAVEA
jgi:uncharacterized protein (DUF2252 family)